MPSRFFSDMRILTCLLAFASLAACAMLDVKPPDPLFSCCAWGFAGGSEKNSAYSGWYHAATTVRLAVKDKALMDQIIKASQELVAMEVTLDGRTITGFKVIKD